MPAEDNSPDGRLRKKLIGTWTMEKIEYSSRVDTNVPPYSRLLISADGTYEFRVNTRGSNHFYYTGKWLVTNGEMRVTAMTSSHPDAVPVGSTDQLKVTSVDSKEFSWFYPNFGQTIYYKRLAAR